jgi:hypothetical protein
VENLGYKESDFRLITGMKKATFVKAMEILNINYTAAHSKNLRQSGRKSKFSMEDKLLATLEYLREYRSFSHIAASYGVHRSCIQRTVKWVENVLIKDGAFSLPVKSFAFFGSRIRNHIN